MSTMWMFAQKESVIPARRDCVGSGFLSNRLLCSLSSVTDVVAVHSKRDAEVHSRGRDEMEETEQLPRDLLPCGDVGSSNRWLMGGSGGSEAVSADVRVFGNMAASGQTSGRLMVEFWDDRMTGEGAISVRAATSGEPSNWLPLKGAQTNPTWEFPFVSFSVFSLSSLFVDHPDHCSVEE